MKTTFKLSTRNAILISKYAAIIGVRPAALLNRILSDRLEQIDAEDCDERFFTDFGFRNPAKAERLRAWLVETLERQARNFPEETKLTTRIEKDPQDGLFYVAGSESYNGLTFTF
jgi:hypothetical protein